MVEKKAPVLVEEKPLFQEGDLIRRHLASSVEDLGVLLCSEQTILDALAVFLDSTSTSEDSEEQKITRVVANLLQYKYSLFMDDTIHVIFFRLPSTPNPVACVETAGNPLQAFLLLWRTTQVWPRALRRLSLHWRALRPKTQEAWRPTFPNSQLASFSLPDEQDYTEVR